MGKVQQLRPNLCCSGLHPLLKSRRTLIWSRSELEISILAKGGRFKTMPFCCLCWCVLSRRQRRNWSLWWKKSCDSSTERSQRIPRTIAELVSWHRQCFLTISSTPAVSSRHLDRLKGLLAKSEGTVALGGRSDDQTRFSLLLFLNGGWRYDKFLFWTWTDSWSRQLWLEWPGRILSCRWQSWQSWQFWQSQQSFLSKTKGYWISAVVRLHGHAQ